MGPLWRSGLSSCVCIEAVSAIICYLFRAIQSVFVSTLAIMLNITAADDSVIPMAMMSHLGVVNLSALVGY